MKLTSGQEKAMKVCVDRYRRNEPFTLILGRSGTGKSTIVNEIIKTLDLNPEQEVVYISYTGRAAKVLKDKGNPNAMTAHRLLTNVFVDKRTGEIRFSYKKHIPYYKLIVVDEISMLPKELWEVLLSHKIHVIALGDPGQLSPPRGTVADIMNHPHAYLNQIMRQAQESDIIKLSMAIQEGKPLQKFKGNDVQVVDEEDVVTGLLSWADQIIASTNAKRRSINQMVREIKYGKDVDIKPQIGDKMVCLRNYHKCVNGEGDMLVNGSIGTVSNIRTSPSQILPASKLIVDFLPSEYNSEDGIGCFSNLHMDYHLLKTGEPSVNDSNWRIIPKKIRPKEFDYGYCITAWKAQGSEWDNVLLYEEGFPYDREEHIKYLYTCLTRASKKAVIVRKK